MDWNPFSWARAMAFRTPWQIDHSERPPEHIDPSDVDDGLEREASRRGQHGPIPLGRAVRGELIGTDHGQRQNLL